MAVIGLPMCWDYQYPAFRGMFEDADTLPLTWADYLRIIETAQDGFEDGNHRVVRVDINPKTFPKWCAGRGIPVNTAAANEYARLIAQARRSE